MKNRKTVNRMKRVVKGRFKTISIEVVKLDKLPYIIN